MKTSRLQPQSGLSLIEMLVVLMIFAVVMSMLVSVFAGGIRVWSRVQGDDEAVIDLMYALEMLERDLRNAVQVGAVPMQGDADALSVSCPVRGEDGFARLCRVTHRFDPTGDHEWMRNTERVMSGQGVEEERVYAGFDAISFMYRLRDRSDPERWEWRARMDPGDDRPSAVRVSVGHEEAFGSELFVRTIVLPESF